MSTIREAADKFSEGTRLLQANDYERAVDAFTEAITLNPNFPNSYRYRAEALQKLGRADDAKLDTEKLASLLGTTRQETGQDRIRRRAQRRREVERNEATPRPATSSYSYSGGGANTIEDYLTFRTMVTPILIQIGF